MPMYGIDFIQLKESFAPRIAEEELSDDNIMQKNL